jgi:acyl carrier protein
MAPDDTTARTATLDGGVAPPDDAAVLATVSELIVAVIGEEYVLDLDIDLDTSFNDDLELESIEFVALSARLREHYGERVDFVAFLADKEVGEIIALTVGDVVGYITASLGAGTARE